MPRRGGRRRGEMCRGRSAPPPAGWPSAGCGRRALAARVGSGRGAARGRRRGRSARPRQDNPAPAAPAITAIRPAAGVPLRRAAARVRVRVRVRVRSGQPAAAHGDGRLCGGQEASPPATRMMYRGLPSEPSEHDSRTTRCDTRGARRAGSPPPPPRGASSMPRSRTPCANSARQNGRPSAARENSTILPHGGSRAHRTGPRHPGHAPADGGHARTGLPAPPPPLRHPSHTPTTSRPRASSSSNLNCASPGRSRTSRPPTCCGPSRCGRRRPAAGPPCPAAARPPRRPARRPSPTAGDPTR